MSLELYERIREAVKAGSDVEPEDSPWKPLAWWACEGFKRSMSLSAAERLVKAAVGHKLMEAKRGRIMCPSGPRAATLYREVPPKKKP